MNYRAQEKRLRRDRWQRLAKPWSDDEVNRAVHMRTAGMRHAFIAAVLQRTERAVSNFLWKAGVR